MNDLGVSDDEKDDHHDSELKSITWWIILHYFHFDFLNPPYILQINKSFPPSLNTTSKKYYLIT